MQYPTNTMKRIAKSCKKRDETFIDFSNCKQIMSSNLPLLFANGCPRSLDTISQPELEEFVPFMILCSLGHNQLMKPKEINNCPVPEWWPQGFPFKFPLVEQSHWISRQVMLKSLVCRCYTFYDCEFLLKFSSELEEMSPSQLSYKENKGDQTTTIYDAAENVLVKCRNENLNYDKRKNLRRYLSPTHRPSMSPPYGKKSEPVIDLTFDTSSENEKEVYFKQAQANKSKKRKTSTDINPQPKQRCVRRVFNDFPKEQPEPEEYSQEQFMAKFQIIPKGKEITKEEVKVNRKKRLAHRFQLLPITSLRGQKLLEQNKHMCNIEVSLERANRYCAPNQELGQETGQVATRSSLVNHSLLENEPVVAENPSEDQNKWCHQFKWPHKTRNPKYPYRGPSIKPCSVQMVALSDDVIDVWTKKRSNVSTMTPELWRLNLAPICACQKIPLIELDEESEEKYKTRSSSTRCVCMPKLQNMAHVQLRRSMSESHSPNYNAAASELYHDGVPPPPPPATLYARPRPRPRPPLTYYAGGRNNSSVLHDIARYHEEPTLHGKLAPHHARRPPLSVVPAPVIIEKKDPDTLCQLKTCTPRQITPSVKINFQQSILEAIKWYTQHSVVPVAESMLKDDLPNIKKSQENIKPRSKMALPDCKNLIDYFQRDIDTTDRDYCYAKSNNCNKLVTRRGVKRFTDREPCPPCFQGRDIFCVYEFVRQAKLAGLTLHNHKQLQLIFIKLIHALTVNIHN